MATITSAGGINNIKLGKYRPSKKVDCTLQVLFGRYFFKRGKTMEKKEARRLKDGIPNFGGNLVLTGYDTERDLKKAKDDIERMLMIVASESIYNIMKFLAPYRAKSAKREQQEYDDLTERAENEQANQEP